MTDARDDPLARAASCVERARRTRLAADAARQVSRGVRAWVSLAASAPAERSFRPRQGRAAMGLRALLLEAMLASEADFGNVQLLEADGLRIAVQQGFDHRFLDFFACVRGTGSACGMAMREGSRILVEDTASHPIFCGTAAAAVMLGAGVGAVQSTPLLGAAGELIGVLSTHHRKPRRFRPGQLAAIDGIAARAARWAAIGR